jgi:hypothetical protein
MHTTRHSAVAPAGAGAGHNSSMRVTGSCRYRASTIGHDERDGGQHYHHLPVQAGSIGNLIPMVREERGSEEQAGEGIH